MLIGFGLAQRFSDPEFAPQPEPLSMGHVLDFYSGGVEPRWLQVARLVHQLATKNYSRARPGRLKRAFVGACAAGAVGLFMVWFLAVSSPVVAPIWFSATIVAFFVASGAIAGALTDSI